ncbi:hypothetical protein Gpo141_00006226 [Globisporangium polare]
MNDFDFSDEELDAFFPADLQANNAYNMRIDLKPIQSTSSSKPSTKRSGGSAKRPGSFHSSSSNKSDMIPLPSGVVPARCGYRTGKCQNLQAVKRNGKLHKLCEFHREKANMNQKKLDRKKRMQRSSPYHDGAFCSEEDDAMSEKSSPRAIDDAFDGADEDEDRHDVVAADGIAPAPTSLHEAPLALGCEEIAIFYSLMTFDINQRAHAMRRPVAVATSVYHHPQPFMSTV